MCLGRVGETEDRISGPVMRADQQNLIGLSRERIYTENEQNPGACVTTARSPKREEGPEKCSTQLLKISQMAQNIKLQIQEAE